MRHALRKSPFHKFLIRCNDLNESAFGEWVFYPGMLFNDPFKWWEDGGVRSRLHEGLDLCFYRDKSGQNHAFNEKTDIPVMYDGKIIHISDDFLGKSLYVSHGIYDDTGNKLHTIYSHTSPYHDIDIGKTLRKGDTIATIADIRKSRAKILPHLHLSVAWLPESFPYEKLSWEIMADCKAIVFCNPLEFIDCKYLVLSNSKNF